MHRITLNLTTDQVKALASILGHRTDREGAPSLFDVFVQLVDAVEDPERPVGEPWYKMVPIPYPSRFNYILEPNE